MIPGLSVPPGVATQSQGSGVPFCSPYKLFPFPEPLRPNHTNTTSMNMAPILALSLASHKTQFTVWQSLVGSPKEPPWPPPHCYCLKVPHSHSSLSSSSVASLLRCAPGHLHKQSLCEHHTQTDKRSLPSSTRLYYVCCLEGFAGHPDNVAGYSQLCRPLC